MTTRVVHVNDGVDGAVYIGRQNGWKKIRRSKWANRFKIGGPDPWNEGKVLSREGALFHFSTWFWQQPDLIRALPELRDKPLACWCRHDGVPMTNGISDDGPDNRCHGDLYVHWLNTFTDDELWRMADGETTQDILESRS